MAKEHVSEKYVKQIEQSAKDFTTAFKSLQKEVVGGEKYKAQLPKTKIALEHFATLKSGFDKEYKLQKNPNLKALNTRVESAEKSIKLDASLVMKLK